MAFFRLDNGSSPADAPTAVVETRIPDAWAQYTKRRRERVRDAKQKFTEMIGDRQYDPDAKTSFDGQIDAETADWLTEDVSTHREYRREIGERLTEAERELTRAERELAAAEEEVKDAEQKMRTPPPGRWQDPEAMLRARHPWWLWFLVGLAISGDLAAFYVVLELMLRQYPVVVAVAVLATSAIAVVCTHAIGRAWRRHVAQVPDRSDAWLWVPLGGWILLGMAAAGVRLFFSSHLASVSAFGAPETSLARGDELAVLPAVIFLALYIGSGICSIYASYEAYD
ncbi:MAG TPA: hypothetical protein VFO16_21945, partial [Pseudonocardiaceae bacterium]|nr:hypothetical protein [Pseudonocardiaceae bacterium]